MNDKEEKWHEKTDFINVAVSGDGIRIVAGISDSGRKSPIQ